MKNKLLTIFTPTFNRAKLLKRTYESLCKQTCDDFKWLIIDDGSKDETEETVAGWISEKKISITYIKKENGGLITGYNTAIPNIDTPLNVCIDSDDWMPDNAVEIIKKEWAKIKDPEIAGLIGLDYYNDGRPIGGEFIIEKECYYWEKFYSIGHFCDTKIVCRTDLMMQLAPLPTFGEKDFNPTNYYKIIGEHYKFKLINSCLCIVEYQPDGMMAGIFHQYRNSPKSFAENRRNALRSKYVPLNAKYKEAIHYVSSSIFAKDTKFINNSPKKVLVLLAVIPGIFLNLYIRFKTRR